MQDELAKVQENKAPEKTLARTANGLAYQCCGNGEKLFLFHGGTGSWKHWIRNIEVLAKQYQVIAFDLPGLGNSCDVAADISVDDYVQFLVAAMQELLQENETFRLTGFSFGGLIASGVAAHFGTRTSKLALLAPGGFGVPVGRKIGRRRQSEVKDKRELHRHNLNAMMIADPQAIDEQALSIQIENVDAARFRSQPLSWTDRIFDFLPRIDCPVQVIYGDKDTTAHPSIEDRIGLFDTLKPEANIAIIPGVGHWLQYEAADQVNEILLKFFR